MHRATKAQWHVGARCPSAIIQPRNDWPGKSPPQHRPLNLSLLNSAMAPAKAPTISNPAGESSATIFRISETLRFYVHRSATGTFWHLLVRWMCYEKPDQKMAVVTPIPAS